MKGLVLCWWIRISNSWIPISLCVTFIICAFWKLEVSFDINIVLQHFSCSEREAVMMGRNKGGVIVVGRPRNTDVGEFRVLSQTRSGKLAAYAYTPSIYSAFLSHVLLNFLLLHSRRAGLKSRFCCYLFCGVVCGGHQQALLFLPSRGRFFANLRIYELKLPNWFFWRSKLFHHFF